MKNISSSSDCEIDPEVVDWIKKASKRAYRKMHLSGLTPDDFFQEGFIAYIKYKNKYDPNHESKTSFKTFIMRYVEGVMVDSVRSFYWLGHTASRTANDSSPKIENDDLFQPESKFNYTEDIEYEDMLNHICKGLTEVEKDMYILYYTKEQTYQEIADKYKISERAVSTRLKNTITPYVLNRAKTFFSEFKNK